MKKSVSSFLSLPVSFAIELACIVHRLVACLAFLIRFAPGYQSDVVPLLEVLQTKGALLGKLVTAVKKSEVKQLVQEVATKLCP